MNCSDFELIILCLAGKRVAGQQFPDDDAVRQGVAHAADCNPCGARLAEERALVAGVREVVADLATQGAPPRLEEALLVAFRRQSRARVASAARLSPIWMVARTRWMFAAAAAFILALVVTVAFLRRQPHQLSRDRQNMAGRVSSEQHSAESDRTNLVATGGSQVGDDRTPSRESNPHRSRKAPTGPAETTTNFFALTDDGDDLTSLESAEVLRVELPASALLAAGLPADLETEGQTVRADVVLGQDGIARAIRFVR